MNSPLRLGILSLIFFFASCTREENARVEAGVATFSSGSQVEFVDFLEYPDGGYVLGANTLTTESWDYWVLRLDEAMRVIWQRRLGGRFDEELQKLMIDRNGNILLSGVSESIDQDSSLKLERRELIYTVLLDPNGSQKWYRTDPWDKHPTYGYYDLPGNQHVLGVFQNEEGEYILAGNFGSVNLDPRTIFTDEITLIKLDANGKILQKGSQYQVNGHAFFPYKDSLYFLGSNLYEKEYGFFVFDRDGFDGSDPALGKYVMRGLNSFGGNSEYYKKQTYTHPNGYLDVLIAVNDQIQRAGFNTNLRAFTFDSYEAPEGQIRSLGRTPDGNYLLNFTNGIQQELDRDFNVLKSFHMSWKPVETFKLSDGSYLGANMRSGEITIMRFDDNGKVLY